MSKWTLSPFSIAYSYRSDLADEVEAIGLVTLTDHSTWEAEIEAASETPDGSRDYTRIATRTFHAEDREIAQAWVEARIALEVAQRRMAEIDFWESSENKMRSQPLTG